MNNNNNSINDNNDKDNKNKDNNNTNKKNKNNYKNKYRKKTSLRKDYMGKKKVRSDCIYGWGCCGNKFGNRDSKHFKKLVHRYLRHQMKQEIMDEINTMLDDLS